jgi:hypothetical protein
MDTNPIDRALRILSIILLIALVGVIWSLVGPDFRSRRPGPESSVIGEIKQLDMAINTFKTRFGVEPPGRLILHEKPSLHPYDLDGTDGHSQVEQATVKFFQRLWPQFPILTCEVDEDGDGHPDRDWIDFNGNGMVDNELDLDGSECLVFFLAGQILHDNPIGFSANPRNPFAVGGPRIPPFLEFDISRLVDGDGDGLREYVDMLPRK